MTYYILHITYYILHITYYNWPTLPASDLEAALGDAVVERAEVAAGASRLGPEVPAHRRLVVPGPKMRNPDRVEVRSNAEVSFWLSK